MRRFLPFVLLLSSCTTIPPESLEIAHNPMGGYTTSIKEPGPPMHAAAGARFTVRAGSLELAEHVLKLAEEDYARVMTHTGLYSFKPAGLYPVYVYADAAEYLVKTGAPNWSGGIAVGNAIYTFEGPRMERTLAHEVAHLIFHEYMGGSGRLRWLNEGLAVYQELSVATGTEKEELEQWLAESHARPMPFTEMARYAPGDSRTRQWYGQSASVARFLVEVGGRTGVERLLTLAKGGKGLDQAATEAFPTLCDSFRALENRWRLAEK